jgi:hypothetical protein
MISISEIINIYYKSTVKKITKCVENSEINSDLKFRFLFILRMVKFDKYNGCLNFDYEFGGFKSKDFVVISNYLVECRVIKSYIINSLYEGCMLLLLDKKKNNINFNKCVIDF